MPFVRPFLRVFHLIRAPLSYILHLIHVISARAKRSELPVRLWCIQIQSTLQALNEVGVGVGVGVDVVVVVKINTKEFEQLICTAIALLIGSYASACAYLNAYTYVCTSMWIFLRAFSWLLVLVLIGTYCLLMGHILYVGLKSIHTYIHIYILPQKYQPASLSLYALHAFICMYV